MMEKNGGRFIFRLMPGTTIKEEELEKTIRDTVSAFSEWGDRRPECAGIFPLFDTDSIPDIVIGVPKTLCNFQAEWKQGSRVLDAVVLLPGSDAVWDSDLLAVLKAPSLNVCGVFRADRLIGKDDRADSEERFLFEEIIKESVRKWLRRNGLKSEEDISKSVRWKASLKDDVKEQGYTSLFADPSTRKMALEVKEAILDLQGEAKDIAKKKITINISDSKNDAHLFQYMVEKLLWPSAKRRVPAILLLGESGTGKTLLARWIASALISGEANFTRINISSMEKSLVDGELFGAAAGAYTDLTRDTPGLFLSNYGKVVFLDEIGDMNSSCQTRLLTFLDDGLVRPLGWHGEAFSSNVIVVAATNRPIRKWVASKDSSFREDLFYRFDYVISLPSLRERRRDMRLLISLTLQEEEVNPGYRKEEGGGIKRISLDAIKAIESMDFPGNFRELRICLKRACASARREGSQTLALRHLMF